MKPTRREPSEPEPLPGQVGGWIWWSGARVCIVETDTEIRLEGLLSESIAKREGEYFVPHLPGDGPCTLAYRALHAAGRVRYSPGDRGPDNRPRWRIVESS